MARAVANCICATCGKHFKRINQYCHNREAADKYEAWAKENCDECPECYIERLKKANNEIYTERKSKYNLPVIKGVSEKQIAYADSLRLKLIVRSKEEDLEEVARIVALPNSDEFIEIVKSDFNGNKEKATAALFKAYDSSYRYLIKAFTEENAHNIIEIFKHLFV